MPEPNRGDEILKDIWDRVENPPKNPPSEWFGDFSKMLCYAPLKLKNERPTPGSDGQKYLVFSLPDPEEIPDQDYSQYTLYEHVNTIIELQCGALIQNKENKPVWTFSLGSMQNLSQEKDPYRTTDPRIWRWPSIQPRREEIHLYPPADSGLPTEIVLAIERFLSSVKPPIRRWGIATCSKKKAMCLFFETTLPKEIADPQPIIEHLRWYTPHHLHWEAFDPQ